MNRVIQLATHVPVLHRALVRRRLASTRGRGAATTRGFTRRETLNQFTALLERFTSVLRRKKAAANPDEVVAAALDHMARELRLGSSLHAAVVAAIERHPTDALNWLGDSARRGDTLHEVIRSRQSDGHGASFALRAVQAASEGGDPVHAVESAARTLRTTAAVTADSTAAVAHTRASINVLTWVPLVIACWMAARDDSIRRFFASPPGVVCLVLGLGLNVLGRLLVRRATRKAATVASEIPDFIDLVSIHLRAGKPPAVAFRCATEACTGKLAESALLVVNSQESGQRFVEALSEHRVAFPLTAQTLIDALIDTERDGLSPRELFERISGEAHAQRRRDAERKIRALPVRLTVPLVGCILPAYVLLAVVPLLAGQLTSVDIDPHPLMEGTP